MIAERFSSVVGKSCIQFQYYSCVYIFVPGAASCYSPYIVIGRFDSEAAAGEFARRWGSEWVFFDHGKETVEGAVSGGGLDEDPVEELQSYAAVHGGGRPDAFDNGPEIDPETGLAVQTTGL